MSIELPQPIAAYYAADKETADAVAKCFTPDAVVQDEGHTYHGSSEIRKWRTDAASKYSYTCEPRSVEQQANATVVTCHLEGNFPGSPVDLRYFFRLAGNKIASLKVIA